MRRLQQMRHVAMMMPPVLALAGCSSPAPGVPNLLEDAECAPLADALSPASGCHANADCPDALCVRNVATHPADGQPAQLSCGSAVGVSSAGSPCQQSAECVNGLCSASGRCLQPCASDTGCGVQERCQRVFVRENVSFEQAAGCVPVVVTWPEVALTDAVDVPLQQAENGEYAAEFPVVAAGLTTVLSGCTAGAPQAERLVTSSLGMALFDRESGISLHPIAPQARPLTLFFPSPLDAVTKGAALRFTVSTPGPGSVTIRRFQRSGAAGGTLDVDVYYVGAGGLAPEGSRGPPRVAAWLAALETHFTVVQIGAVRQHEISGELRDRLSFINRDFFGFPELAELGGLTAGELTPSLSLFLVDSIQGLAGFSGGVPGATSLPGTAGAAVVLAVEGQTDEVLARSLAHETGHFLGLFHTTEPSGGRLEALDDTPACPVSQDSDGNSLLSSAECSAFDGENLMFWESTGDRLSDAQLTTVSESPLLRPL